MKTNQQIKNSVPCISRITLHVIFLIVILVGGGIGCSGDQAPKSGRWEIVRRADWEARFYDVFFIDERTGWTVGNNAGSTFAEELDSADCPHNGWRGDMASTTEWRLPSVASGAICGQPNRLVRRRKWYYPAHRKWWGDVGTASKSYI